MYHYSSDGLNLNNCGKIEMFCNPTAIYVNFSRIDADSVLRTSQAIVETSKYIPNVRETLSNIHLTFNFHKATKKCK